MINTEERTLTASPWVAVVELTQPNSYRRGADLCTPLLKAGLTLKTNRLLCAWLVFVFIGQSIGKKNIWRNLTASHYFRPVPKIEKRWLRYSNCCAVWELLIVIFRRIKCDEEYQAICCCFFSWFCTDIQCWNLYFY